MTDMRSGLAGALICSLWATAARAAQAAPVDDGNQILLGAALLGLLLAVIAALLAVKALAEHTTERFGWPLILNAWNLVHLVAAFAVVLGAWFDLFTAGLVVGAGLWLVVLLVNIRRTDLITGVTMSIVQPLVVWILYAAINLGRGAMRRS